MPPEEPSVDDVVGQQQVLDRNYEVKLLSLQRGRQEFDDRLQAPKTQSETVQSPGPGMGNET